MNLPFKVLADLDLAYALSLGLVFWVGVDVDPDFRHRMGMEAILGAVAQAK
jgi:hypothetical protein